MKIYCILVCKCLGYLLVIFMGLISISKQMNNGITYIISFFLSLPMTMMFANFLHELGHMLFCKLCGLKVTRWSLGIFQYDFTQRKWRLDGNKFLSGNCSFIIRDDLVSIVYFLTFMGGVILNITALIVCLGLILNDYSNLLLHSVAVCCTLNAAANGLYHKSTDRKLLDFYMNKRKSKD